jgi:hypothetical protein
LEGAFRRRYRDYQQGAQRYSGAFCRLPKGPSFKAFGGVIPLGNGLAITGAICLAKSLE